jgi:cyclopropane fatty-acyl-phospholipid synthase-like methyltransferase
MIAEISNGRKCDLLDVGCGPASLRKLVGSNVNYHGIDIAIQAPAPCLHEVDLAQNVISFDNKKFDIVVSLGVFEYMGRHQAQKFEEISRLLKPNGKFIMSYVNFHHYRKVIYDMYNNVQTIGEMRHSLEQTFAVERCFPECHHWRHKQPGRNALPALQMKIEHSIPLFSRLFAVEYFFVCSRRSPGAKP